MGALHSGHLSLMDRARQEADLVVASIFVNPKQFGPDEDFERYPRTADADAVLLAEAGVNLLWMPGVEEIYPDGFATTVSVAGLGDGYCGAARPGHFDGVATVVAKLLNQVRPDVAIFGEKDWQQLAIIRRMARDLDMDIEILGAPIVREADGLAMSSRNRYLDGQERARATALPRALKNAASAIARGEAVDHALEVARSALADAGFSPIDYIAHVDSATLMPADVRIASGRILAAAWMGNTRLIDNLAVD
jgi:pantoate--beta-alanine ligase